MDLLPILSLLLVVVVQLADAGKKDFKIVGGQEVDIFKVPWQAALLRDDQLICGATIVSEYWFLSAAHCVEGVLPWKLKLRVGSNEHHSGGETCQVKTYTSHQGFNYTGPNDISALKTWLRIPFSDKVAPAKLPDPHGPDPAPPGTEVTISGWGRTGRQPQISAKLRAAKIRVANFTVCRDVYDTIEVVDSQQLCAGSRGREACNGDSGGPMMVGDVLVGIVSYGDLQCGSDLSVYTRVSGYRDWIRKYTGL